MNRLSNVKILEVSLCPKGMNKDARVALFKSDDDSRLQSPDSGDNIQERLATIENIVKQLQEATESGAAKETDMKLDEALAKLADGDTDVTEAITKALTDAEAQRVALEKERDELKKAAEEANKLEKEEDDEVSDPLEKARKAGASEDLINLIKSQQDALAKSEAEAKKNADRLAKMEADQRKSALLAKSKAEFGHLGDSQEIADLLWKLESEGMSAETAEAVMKTLKTADERIAQGDLLKERGRVGSENLAGPLAKAASMARELMKAKPELTLEQAEAQVYENNPELYDQALRN